MSLLDKKKGLAMLPALFLLFACEEPSELGVGLNPKEDEISTHYLEIPVETAQIRIDTIASSSLVTIIPNATGSGSASYRPVLIGKASDPTFGNITATAFTNIGTPIKIPVVAQSADVDSLILRLSYSGDYIGNNISAPQTLHIFSLEDPIEPTSGSAETKALYKYSISSSEPLAEELEEISFDTATFNKRTIVKRLDSSGSLALANRILDVLKSDTTLLKNQKSFNEIVGGLAFVPGEDNTFIANYYFAGASQIELYYGDKTTPVILPFIPELGEGQSRAAGDYLPTYFNLETDYSNTLFENAPSGNNVEFQNPDNQVYFRAGVGLLPKINFSGLQEFVNSHTVGEVVVNQAVLVIDSVFKSNPRESFPAQANFFFVEKENNKLIRGVTEPYAGASLLLNNPTITSNKDTVYSYRADVTEEIERLIQTGDENFLQGIISPATSSSSLLNFGAEPNRIVLKIMYTELKTQNKQDN